MSSLGTAVRRLLGTTGAAGDAPGADAGLLVQAVWRDTVLAESEHPALLEGNLYFPPEDVDFHHLVASERRTTCPWKGVAAYYDVVVEAEENPAAAWFYPQPSATAAMIRDHVAFWHGVEVRQAPRG